ncbi:MAG: phosphonate metabolism [Peptococcaceae bacterium]|jgi:alpha-D-ribose 1-methylphosphonate 5-triphosphate synthase subunit PhnI|nr:phosphonate metabolism [Peptococcaceae bacterium]
MGYVAVQGGITAIKNAEELTKYMRLRGKSIPLSVKQIQDQMRFLVDRVMGEGGLYSPFHASLAIKQAQGDPIEASFYLRAYRSTLPRLTESLPLEMEEMRITRRISSAFKNIPGGQILGATTDYHQRMLDFSLLEEEESQVEEFLHKQEQEKSEESPSWGPFRKVVDILREQELVKPTPEKVEEPIFDITQNSVAFPAPRSARLQMLARSETGGILALAYSSMRGFGSVHPTIAELRVGFVPVNIPHPYRKNKNLTIGFVEITEVEIVAKFAAEEKGEKPYFTLGYGICFGSNELKAISMAVLDRAMKEKEAKAPAQDQEFVLLHTDGIESSGFCSHFKLPHYITFQSALDRLRSTQEKQKKIKLTKEKRL